MSSVNSQLTVDCACLIHSNGYSWKYVDTLYSMLSRHLSAEVRLHVYTEPSRIVPAPYIKHELEDWGISGPKKSWWYKIQLFNSKYHSGPLLYLDLDTVIVKNIDWIVSQEPRYVWAPRDFKYLWKPSHTGINSSVMYWNTQQFDWIYQNFLKQNLQWVLKKYPGDQDYISDVLTTNQIRHLDPTRIRSWRWETLDGGYDFKRRVWHKPGAGTNINDNTSVLVLHGKPKPDQTQDPVIVQHWQ